MGRRNRSRIGGSPPLKLVASDRTDDVRTFGEQEAWDLVMSSDRKPYFCADCTAKDIDKSDGGTASECGHHTAIAGAKYCARCAIELKRCRTCGIGIAAHLDRLKAAKKEVMRLRNRCWKGPRLK